VRKHFPDLTIFARARNRQHAYALMDLGIDNVVRDTFHPSLEMAKIILTDLGLGSRESAKTVERFRDHDIERLHRQRPMAGDVQRMAEDHQNWVRELESMFDEDRKDAESERDPA